MEKKTILAACAAATLAFTGCSGGFSAAEKETIHAGKGEIMRILTVGNPADSLVLRQKAAPVTGRMLRTDDYAVRWRVSSSSCSSWQYRWISRWVGLLSSPRTRW